MPRAKPRTKRAKRAKVSRVMGEHKRGTLRPGSGRSGSGRKVRSRRQAVAITMSESGQSRTRRRKR